AEQGDDRPAGDLGLEDLIVLAGPASPCDEALQRRGDLGSEPLPLRSFALETSGQDQIRPLMVARDHGHRCDFRHADSPRFFWRDPPRRQILAAEGMVYVTPRFSTGTWLRSHETDVSRPAFEWPLQLSPARSRRGPEAVPRP